MACGSFLLPFEWLLIPLLRSEVKNRWMLFLVSARCVWWTEVLHPLWISWAEARLSLPTVYSSRNTSRTVSACPVLQPGSSCLSPSLRRLHLSGCTKSPLVPSLFGSPHSPQRGAYLWVNIRKKYHPWQNTTLSYSKSNTFVTERCSVF